MYKITRKVAGPIIAGLTSLILASGVGGCSSGNSVSNSINWEEVERQNPVVNTGYCVTLRDKEGNPNVLGFESLRIEDNGGFTGPAGYIGYMDGHEYRINLNGKLVSRDDGKFTPWMAGFNAYTPSENVNISQ